MTINQYTNIDHGYELAGDQAEPETPGVVESHDAAGVVAGALATALEVHGERQIQRVADARPDNVADEQRGAGHDGEVAAVARHHVEQDQSQPPQRQSRPVTHNNRHSEDRRQDRLLLSGPGLEPDLLCSTASAFSFFFVIYGRPWVLHIHPTSQER